MGDRRRWSPRRLGPVTATYSPGSDAVSSARRSCREDVHAFEKNVRVAVTHHADRIKILTDTFV
jgi:hypothetical protein